MQCLSIFKALVRVFKKPKAIASDGIPEGEKKKRKKSRALSVMPKSRKRRDARAGFAKIEMLPDELLLEIFDCHRLATIGDSSGPWKWHRLAHVSRRWRHLIFESPCRLDLQLVYTYKNPIRKTPDIWPPLPISIWYPRSSQYRRLASEDEENVLAALKHPKRICELELAMTRQLASKSAVSMGASFPVLERLHLRSQDTIRSLNIPIGFLGGSTPQLRHIHLVGTSFPTLPVLLLSTQALVSLQLDEIPNTGYFSPEEFVISLTGMAQLKSLKIHFVAPNSHERSIDATLPNRVILPALTEFEFKGNCEYVEDLVSRIDAPALEQINVTFFEQPTFGILRLSRFIGRTKEVKSPHHTSIRLSEDDIIITQYFRRPSSVSGTFQLQIPCEELDRQVPLLIHVCRHLSELLSGVERFDIKAFPRLSSWMEGEEMDSTVWLELFRPFRGVKKLEVTGELVSSIASAFERATGEMARIVLPALRDLHLFDFPSPSASIEPFIAARQLCNRPVTVHYEREESLDHTSEND